VSEFIIGVVSDGVLRVLWPKRPPTLSDLPARCRLTRIDVIAAQPPESQELGLGEYEGMTVAVEGRCDGDWIYGAKIVDTGGPIVTAIAEKIFGSE